MSKYTSLCGYVKTEQIAAKCLLLRVNFDGSNGIGGDIAEVLEELVALYMRGRRSRKHFSLHKAAMCAGLRERITKVKRFLLRCSGISESLYPKLFL